MLNNRHVHRKKNPLDIHSHIELFIQWIKCRHRWLGGELDSLFTSSFFPSSSLQLFEKITFELILSCSKGFSRLFSSMGQNEKGESKIIYRLLLNRRRRKKNRELRSFFFKVDINNERYCFVFTYRLSVKYKKKKSRIFDKKKQFKLILSFFVFIIDHHSI